MKTNLLNIILGAMLVPLAAVLSCSKEQLAEQQPETGKYTITVAAGQIGGLTKTTVEVDGTAEEPYKSVWKDGDCAGLFIGKDANVKMTIDHIEDGVAYFKGELSEKPAVGEQIYLYYPYNEAQGESLTFGAVSCHFPYGQNPAGLGTYDDNVDYMWGNTVVGEDGTVSGLKLAYAVGFIRFSVKSVAGTVDFADGGSETLTKDDKVLTVSIEAKPADASAKKLVGDFTVNLENGECLVPEKSSENNVGPKVIINCPDGTNLGNLDVWTCVHPFELTSPDDVLRFWIQTEKHYIIREVKVSELKTTTFSVAAGQVKAFDVNITNSAWNISVNPYRGGVIKTPEQFLRFVQDVKNGSYLDREQTIGGNQYATLAPDASVENRGIDKWLDENGVAKLGNDITISTSAMSTYGNLASVPLWTKTFDGQGHTITFEDGTLRRPIFANVFKIDENSPGIVRNLKVAGNMTSPQVPYTQGTCPLVGILHDGEVIGCQSDVNINITSYNASLDGGNIAMAGICRTMQGGKITGCVNNGEISFNAALTKPANVYAGGIVALVGKNYGKDGFGRATSCTSEPFAGAVTISGCTNNKPVSLHNTATNNNNRLQYCAIGGVAGWIWGGVPENDRYVTISDCGNFGALTVDETSFTARTTGIAGVGGVIGWAGPVAFDNSAPGRILGPVYGSGDESQCVEGFYLKINNCHNHNGATISASRKCGGSTEVGSTVYTHKVGCGGIAGILFGQYNGSMAEISGCVNDGTIIGYVADADKDKLGQGSRYNVSGGIVGYGGSVRISDCSVSGNVGVGGYNFSAAGIIGCAYQKFAISGAKVKDLTVYRGNNQINVIYASLIANYASSMKRNDYSVYAGTSVVSSRISGTVGGSKLESKVVKDYPSLLTDSGIMGDVNYKDYCVLSSQDIAKGNADSGPIKLGYITISGTTHYTE